MDELINSEQRKKLNKLWFIYGNNGPKSTKGNHGFIQGFLERNSDDREFYLQGIQNMRDRKIPENVIIVNAITQECINEVDKILKT